MYIIVIFFEFFDCEGAKYREKFHYMGTRLNQHVYYKGILQNLGLRICCFGKEVLLSPQRIRTCRLLSDQYGLIYQHTLKGHCEYTPQNTSSNKQQEAVWREITIPTFPNIVYKSLFTFKGGYAIEMDTLHWFGSCLLIQIQVNSVIYVYFCS